MSRKLYNLQINVLSEMDDWVGGGGRNTGVARIFVWGGATRQFFFPNHVLATFPVR